MRVCVELVRAFVVVMQQNAKWRRNETQSLSVAGDARTHGSLVVSQHVHNDDFCLHQTTIRVACEH